MVSWGCGQFGHLRKDCTQRRRAFALFGQESDLTCKVMLGGKGIMVLIDTGASISMIRTRDHFQIGFKKKKLGVMKQKNISGRLKRNKKYLD